MLVLGFDPGETTGYVAVEVNEDGSKIRIVDQRELKTFDDLFDVFTDHVYNSDIIVFEDFVIYPNKAKSLSGNRVYPVQVIGILQWQAWSYDVPIVGYMASRTKQLWPDKELKVNFGADLPKSRHVRDALRVVLTYLELEKKVEIHA